jgi:hypothetical protein
MVTGEATAEQATYAARGARRPGRAAPADPAAPAPADPAAPAPADPAAPRPPAAVAAAPPRQTRRSFRDFM